MAEDIDANEAARRIAAGSYLLDVREQAEWDEGHAPQARHLALSSLAAEYGQLPKDQEIVVVCKVGGRSGQAAAFLEREGYNTVNLDGGMLAWAASGFAVVDNQQHAGQIA
jgi:rhodanese-related sulfurtransferase